MDLHQTKDTKKQPALHTDEYQVRHLLKDFNEAVIARDVDKIMSFYAPDIVAYDIVPPLQYVGKKAYQKTWEEAFTSKSEGNIVYEAKDWNITVNDNVAFAYGLVHNIMTSDKGKKMELYMRCTRCFEKIRGNWLITHEQFSVPVDFANGKALMDLKPTTKLH